jgi:DNA-binding transcriptional ArsR family regulator
MSLPAVMQHLAVLEGSGLVRSAKVGRVRTCRIEPKALSLAEQWINQRRAEWEQHFDQPGKYSRCPMLPPPAALRDPLPPVVNDRFRGA